MTVRNNWQTVRRHNAVHIIYESSGDPWDFKTNAEEDMDGSIIPERFGDRSPHLPKSDSVSH